MHQKEIKTPRKNVSIVSIFGVLAGLGARYNGEMLKSKR